MFVAHYLKLQLLPRLLIIHQPVKMSRKVVLAPKGKGALNFINIDHRKMYCEILGDDESYSRRIDFLTYGRFWEQLSRDDETLVKMAEKVNDPAIFRIVEVPLDVKYTIEVADDMEYVEEKHRIWC